MIESEEKMGKVSIEKTQNGYIVRVLRSNCSNFKEPYLKAVMVFENWHSMVDWLVLRF